MKLTYFMTRIKTDLNREKVFGVLKQSLSQVCLPFSPLLSICAFSGFQSTKNRRIMKLKKLEPDTKSTLNLNKYFLFQPK